MTEREARYQELDLEVQLLSGKKRRVFDLQKHLDVDVGAFQPDKSKLKSKKSAQQENSPDDGRLEVEQWAALAAIVGDERPTHGFAGPICTGYASLMRALASRYRH